MSGVDDLTEPYEDICPCHRPSSIPWYGTMICWLGILIAILIRGAVV